VNSGKAALAQNFFDHILINHFLALPFVAFNPVIANGGRISLPWGVITAQDRRVVLIVFLGCRFL
jgi:hypothetical protein